MPSNAVKSVARASGKTVNDIEKIWQEAATKVKDPTSFGLVMNIFKKMVKSQLGAGVMTKLGWKSESYADTVGSKLGEALGEQDHGT